MRWVKHFSPKNAYDRIELEAFAVSLLDSMPIALGTDPTSFPCSGRALTGRVVRVLG